MDYQAIKEFADWSFHHFNGRVMREAAAEWAKQIKAGNKMFISLAGAFSTARMGKWLAPLIRAGAVHGISCTGANLEEGLFRLIANNSYVDVPNYQSMTPADEIELRDKGLCRVTDVCIPENEAMEHMEKLLKSEWKDAAREGKRYFPHEYMYAVIRSGKLNKLAQLPMRETWLIEAAKKNMFIVTPGAEDSTIGNKYVAEVIKGQVSAGLYKDGYEAMQALCAWYEKETKDCSMGFFQLGGGIAGDMPICCVPLLKADLKARKQSFGACMYKSLMQT